MLAVGSVDAAATELAASWTMPPRLFYFQFEYCAASVIWNTKLVGFVISVSWVKGSRGRCKKRKYRRMPK